jgi:hypothetical protein
LRADLQLMMAMNLNDADLEVVVSAWGKLPSALKAGIVAMVRAAGDAK